MRQFASNRERHGAGATTGSSPWAHEVYGIIQLIKFAHGEVFMVGAFAPHRTVTGAGFAADKTWVAMPAVIVAMARRSEWPSS